MSNRTFKTTVIAVSVLVCSFASLQSLQGKPAAKAPARSGPKQCIFSRSNRATTSSALGITGVPAYVVFPNGGQQCGIYIMQMVPGGTGAAIGLRPGKVLLTVDGRTAQSPSSVDGMLSSRSGSIDVTYAYVSDGVPSVVRKRVNYGGPALGMAPAVGAATESANLGNALVNDTTPLGELESQMVSLINKDRAANHEPPVSTNGRLTELARNYANYLQSRGAFSHEADGRDPGQRARAAGIGGGIAENLAFEARVKPDKDSVRVAQQKFMDEPPNQHNHRFNILWSDAKSVGVGIARSKGQLMMVQEFSDGTP